MKDMNKITGGTEAQRKIAQDRQRRREAKNKGFDPNKDVLADKSSVKKPAPATKAEADKDPLKQAHDKAMAKTSGLAKTGQKALPPSDKGGNIEKRKPDLRKSQIGKWAEGSKKSPGALAKKAASAVTKSDPIEKVDVKVDEPKKKPTPAPGNKRTPVPDRTYPPTKPNTPEMDPENTPDEKEKKKKDKFDFSRFRDPEKSVSNYAGQQERGLQQRGNQVSS